MLLGRNFAAGRLLVDLSKRYLLQAWVDANLGEVFCLPSCRDCGLVLYPLRENCTNCLSTDLAWEPVDNNATVIESTSLHHTLEPHLKEKLPWHVALVKMDAGPVALVTGSEAFQSDTRIVLQVYYEASGSELPMIVAKPSLPKG